MRRSRSRELIVLDIREEISEKEYKFLEEDNKSIEHENYEYTEIVRRVG